MSIYRFNVIIPEDHKIAVPDEVPVGPVEVTVYVAEKAEPTRKDNESLPETVARIMSNLSEEDLASLPVDGAEQHDHYIYGLPKTGGENHECV